jgi:hypothetical protein
MFWEILTLAAFTSLCMFGIGFGLSRLGDRRSDKK